MLKNWKELLQRHNLEETNEMPIVKKYSDLIILLLLVIVLILLLILFTDMHVAKINREIKQAAFIIDNLQLKNSFNL